ncbi:MAG: MFS transporter [Spirochaetes bacterium]|jgi:predicted MFS family arabinose efflux permease|nr:MFS transporter [Spirochaetota bacterium]
MKREVKVYFAVLSLTALSLALSHDLFSNYFKDAYGVTTFQRGTIELPRELPGMLCFFVVALLSSLSDIRIAMIAQLLSFTGIMVLGLTTPPYLVMLFFLFINSMGMHLFLPIQDSIALSLVDKNRVGKRMGQFRGAMTGFQMVGAIIAFIGFKTGVFSFTTDKKWVFIISGAVLLIVVILLIILDKMIHHREIHHKKVRFVFRKEYRLYYVLVIMFGVQKQMMMVYAPWVLIELLHKKADTLSMLYIMGSFAGIFFIPALGRWTDRFGIRNLLFADAISFIGVYLLYGLLVYGYTSGLISVTGLPLVAIYVLFVIDRMSTQMGMIRVLYLKEIALHTSDITPTLSLGISVDHVVSISSAFLGGIVWVAWGPHYIFFLVAALSLVNLWVAFKVRISSDGQQA